jgi:hypothetical protein
VGAEDQRLAFLDVLVADHGQLGCHGHQAAFFQQIQPRLEGQPLSPLPVFCSPLLLAAAIEMSTYVRPNLSQCAHSDLSFSVQWEIQNVSKEHKKLARTP